MLLFAVKPCRRFVLIKSRLLTIILLMFCAMISAGCGGGSSGGSANPVAATSGGVLFSGRLAGEGDLGNVPVYLVGVDAQVPPLGSLRAAAEAAVMAGQLYFSVTDESGAFAFQNVTPGYYNLVARKDRNIGGIRRNLAVGLQASTMPADLELLLTATGEITGQVSVPADFSGRSGVVAFVPGTSYAAYTDENGAFAITGVPVGSYSVLFSAPGLAKGRVDNISVGAAQATTLPLITLSRDNSFFIGITWKGTQTAHPASPQPNWAYYNSTDKKAYIFDGSAWQILAESITGPQGPAGPQGPVGATGTQGLPGPAGANGIGIIWKGVLPAAPSSPTLNWAYYNSNEKKAYIWNGQEWSVLVESGFGSSDTTAPFVSRVFVQAISTSSAVISWHTNESSTAQVYFGLTSQYGNETTIGLEYAHDHMVLLDNLLPGTSYHFQAASKDSSGNEGSSPDQIFTTDGMNPPDKPSISAPVAAAVNVSTVPILQSSVFSDMDMGNTHLATDWEIYDDAGLNPVNRVWSKLNSREELISITVNRSSGVFENARVGQNGLAYNKQHWVRVRYYDNSSNVSSWSSAISFTTTNVPAPPVKPQIVSPANDATGISANPIVYTSVFSDPDAGDTHLKTDWEVYDNAAMGSANRVWYKLADVSNRTMTQITGMLGTFENSLSGTQKLGYSQTYWVRCRYYDSNNNAGAWSEAVSFKVINAPVVGSAIQIEQGGGHLLILRYDGTVWALGDNTNGQIGDGTYAHRYEPVQVVGLENVIQIGCGHESSFALKEDGTVWAWGNNVTSVLGTGVTAYSSIPIQVKDSLDPSGLLLGIAKIAVSSPSSHVLALRSDGSVFAWGFSSAGQCGVISSRQEDAHKINGISEVVDIAVSYSSSFALKSDGALWGWGGNVSGELANDSPDSLAHQHPIFIVSNTSKLAAGRNHVCVEKTDGTLWAWGDNSIGQIGDGSYQTRYIPVQVLFNQLGIRKLSAFGRTSLAILEDGNAYHWGEEVEINHIDGVSLYRKTPTQLQIKDLKQICLSFYLKNNGTVWNADSGSQILIPAP